MKGKGGPKPGTAICAHKGCDARLAKNNRSGYCQTHLTSTSSKGRTANVGRGTERNVPITLPRPPWEP
jgi:hypothetical protein